MTQAENEQAGLDDRLDHPGSERTEPDDQAGWTQPPAGPAGPAGWSGTGRRRVRFGTVVLGLVLAVVAVTVWCARVLELDVSVGGVATAAMIGAGVILLAGAVSRPDRRTAGPPDRLTG